MNPSDLYATNAGAQQLAEVLRLALNVADRAAVCDIECECVMHDRDEDGNRRWLDTRPMLDPREHDPALIDMARESLAYARARGLIEFMVGHPHLVRVLRRP
jgi:hypothetical protein